MFSLLLEEIHEVESIYHNIDKQLNSMYKVSELEKLINAVKTEVITSIDELEWIRQEIIRGLKIFLQRNKEMFKDLYTQALRILHTIKYRAIVLNRLVNIVTFYVHLIGNDKYRDSLIALKKFVNSTKWYLENIPDINLYVLVEYGYLTINILKEHDIMILCIPSYDLFKTWKWTLLLHELGHILFNTKKNAFIKEFRGRIMPLLKQLAPIGVKERINVILSTWEQYWIEEFVSDLYGVAIGGPAYTYAFMIEVFNSNPSEYIKTHPSLDARMYLQLKYLESIAEIKELVKDIQELWFSHRKNIPIEELGYPFTARVLEELNKIFIEIIGRPVFLNYIDEVIELREKINKGSVMAVEPLYLVLALALSDKRREDEVQRKAIKVIMEDR